VSFEDLYGRLELTPDYPEAHLTLLDALRGYIRVDALLREELLSEGAITREQAQDDEHIRCCRRLLAELERHEMDPTLGGVRR